MYFKTKTFIDYSLGNPDNYTHLATLFLKIDWKNTYPNLTGQICFKLSKCSGSFRRSSQYGR